MDRDEEQKHITLAWFDASFLRPSFEEYGLRFNKGGLTAGLGAYYLAEIIEGYFWLALGISLNVFPLDASRSLVRQRASIFRNLPSFAKSWRHVIDSALLENISRAVALNEFFVTKDPRASVHPERLVSHFLAASLMATRFGQDSIARSFVVALNFYSEDLLDVIEAPSFKTTEKTDFAKLERAFGVEVGSILEGYLRCLGHMASFSSFFEGVKEWRGVEPTDRLYFTRNIKQNTGWRIDFGRYTSNRVFLALAERVAESVPRSARRYFDRGFLKEEVSRLLGDWIVDVGTDAKPSGSEASGMASWSEAEVGGPATISPSGTGAVLFDRAYLDALGNGDSRAQNDLISCFYRPIQLKLRVLPRRELVEDASQETFLRVLRYFRSGKTLENPASLPGFVNTVCDSVAVELLRSHARSPLELPKLSREPADRSAISSEERLFSEERKAAVRRILHELPRRDQELLQRVFLDEEDRDLVCRELHLDRSYLRVLLHRARLRLKARLLWAKTRQA